MTRPRLLIGLLIAATVLVDLVVWSIAAADPWPETDVGGFAHVVLWSLVFAQVSLVAIWLGLGKTWVPLRLAALLLGILSWTRLLQEVFSPHTAPKYYSTTESLLFFAQAMVIVSVLAAARLVGVRLVQATDLLSRRCGTVQRPQLQFSLAYLFCWLTAVGVVLGVSQFVIDWPLVPNAVLNLAGYGLGLITSTVGSAAIALLALWTALATRWLAMRIGMLCAATLVMTTIECRCVALTSWWAIWQYLLQLCWLLGSLWVCRVAGYRLVWRGAVRP